MFHPLLSAELQEGSAVSSDGQDENIRVTIMMYFHTFEALSLEIISEKSFVMFVDKIIHVVKVSCRRKAQLRYEL